MNKYRDWDILDHIPQGWIIDKTAGAPAPNTVFITNGKSVLSGQQKRALLKVVSKIDENTQKNDIVKPHFHEVTKIDENTQKNDIVKPHFHEVTKIDEKTEIQIFPAKTVNDLARLKFKEQLLKEIMCDLMVCEIENWDKKEYINELKKMLNGINTSNKKKVNVNSLPDLFSSVGL